MKTALFLLGVVCVCGVVTPSVSIALPNCEQVNEDWCEYKPNWTASIDWGACSEQTELQWWRCMWTRPGFYPVYSDWTQCWCLGDHPGCDCLLEGTAITLADGRTKPVEAVQAGDQVLAFDESTGAMVRSLVLRTYAPLAAPGYLVINERLRVTENHPMLSAGSWVAAGSLSVGDRLTSVDGPNMPVFSIRKVAGKVKVYNFQVAVGTYVAEGIIVHNKEDCELYMQWCPDCP